MDIFWDAADIHSPGLFPVGFEPEGCLSGEESSSKPRDQLIASTLYKAGDIETYGTGLQRIKAACGGQGVPVEVYERGHSVHVRFTRSESVAAANSPTTNAEVPKSSEEFRSGSEEFPSGLSKNELAAYRFIAEHGASRTAEIATAIGMTPRGTLKLLQRLEGKGVVVGRGSTRDRTYSLI